MKELYAHGTSLNSVNISWACFFPDVELFSIGEEHEAAQIGWKNNLSNLEDFCKRAALSFCRKKETYSKGYKFENHLPKLSECKEIVEKFRPDFEVQVSLKSLEEETESELIQLTKEQFVALDAISDNERVLFRGGAGTGKTLLAAEAFRRSISEGNKTLFIVYSNLLGEWMGDKLKEYCGHGSEIDSITAVATRHCPNELHDADFFENKLPYVILDRIEKGLIQPFDYLIIDEAQDILNTKYYDVADALVKGGLKNGKWVMFGDFERQAILHDSTDPVLLLKDHNVQFSQHRLRQNCRNTSKVYDYLISFSGFGTEDPPIKRNIFLGDPVVYKFYENQENQAEIINETITDLKAKNIPLDRITLVSPKPYVQTCLGHITEYKITDISHSADAFLSKKGITFSDIRNFKGLENNYIIVMDIESVGQENEKLMYVAISRCKFKLYLLIDKKNKTDIVLNKFPKR
jgi:superfamily I DNA/RNA helicase